MTDSDVTSSILREQKESKPNIEHAIPVYLSGGAQAIALDFARYMAGHKMALRWAGFTNAWKAVYKGKCICYVRMIHNSDCKDRAWVITPYLTHMDEYEETVRSEGLHELVFNNLFHCKRCFPEKYPEGRPCVPGRDIVLLGEQIKGVCVGRQPIWIWEPDEAAICGVISLLELEKEARNQSTTQQ